MKYFLRLLPWRFVLMVPLLAFCYAAPVETGKAQNTWVKIANRTVTYTVDHSEMVIDGVQQSLTGLRVKVIKGAINLHRCTVFYSNGQTLDIEILNSIPEGSESKIIELPAGNPIIARIVFTYDTKNRAIQKAEVECWGRTN
ncbi:MAG: hypothetical protein WCF67_17725 [Chitinophagaceae bacterium]